MGRYLKVAMTVVARLERRESSVALAGGEKSSPPVTGGNFGVPSTDARYAACGSASCAGCYEVGDGKKIHPPKCGHGYSDWLKRWEPRGRKQ
jgi:hypothetical protein